VGNWAATKEAHVLHCDGVDLMQHSLHERRRLREHVAELADGVLHMSRPTRVLISTTCWRWRRAAGNGGPSAQASRWDVSSGSLFDHVAQGEVPGLG
jgi:hypothetical protein